MTGVDPQIRIALDAIVRDLRKLQRDTNRLLAVLKAQRAERPLTAYRWPRCSERMVRKA